MEWNHGKKNEMEWKMYTARVTSAVQCYASFYVSIGLLSHHYDQVQCCMGYSSCV